MFTVVGHDALLRALRIWNDVTSDFGLRMAIARKRQVGPCISWIGFNFYLPVGIITVTPEKLSRAHAVFDALLSGAVVTFDCYRRLLGLLEHLLLIVGGDRTWLYGCYFSAVLSSSLLCIPPLPVALWFSDIFGARPVSDIIFSLYSDAYAVSATGGGLGGYAHGLYWHLPLSLDDVALLHITAWEFVALALNVVIFGPRVVGSAVNLYSDAMATVQVMLRQDAFSPDMQLIHSLLVSLPEFQALGINVFSDHVYGRINVLGDAASRALFELVHRVTAQLGVAAHRLVVPPRALDFVDEVRRRVAARVAVEDTALVPATPRPQSLAERQRMHHLGLSHLNSTSREFRFRFPSK